MGRLSGYNATAVAAGVIRPVQFVKLAFPSVTFRAHTWPGASLSFGGETYTCGSDDVTLVNVGSIGERADSKVAAVNLVLAATHARLKEVVRLDKWHFSRVTLGEGYLNEAHQLVGEPYNFGSYLLSSVDWGTESGSRSLTCEPVSIRLRRTSLITSSDADQQARYASDTFFRYTAAVEDREFAWGGRRAIIYMNGGSGAGGGGSVFGLYGSGAYNGTTVSAPTGGPGSLD
jgi:hypothetical protein